MIHLKIDIKIIYNQWDYEFVFDYVQLFVLCHKINFSRGGSSYLSFLYWIKNKKAAINIITVALNHDEIKNDLQRVTKIKRFVKKYNWEGTKFSSQKDDWKKFEKNNVTIALNVLYVNKEKKLSCLHFKT